MEMEAVGISFANALCLDSMACQNTEAVESAFPAEKTPETGRTLINGASSRNGPARMLATTTSAFISSG